MWHTSVGLDQPVSIGEYQFAKTPDEPTVLHLSTNPNKPGLPRKQQHKAGWRLLLETSWEQVELETRRELARILGPGGFDPAADILGITVNRWPHGFRLEVRDTGAGIEPEFLPHVFDRFRQGRSVRQEGVGLGLAIVRHLVELHGGTVTAQSDGSGKGSSFVVELPALLSADAAGRSAWSALAEG